MINGEKVTIYDNKIVFKKSGKTFTLRGDVLKMITDYKYNTTDPPDAKIIINIMVKTHSNIHAKGKIPRDRNLIKNYFNKRALLASGLRTKFPFRKS